MESIGYLLLLYLVSSSLLRCCSTESVWRLYRTLNVDVHGRVSQIVTHHTTVDEIGPFN